MLDDYSRYYDDLYGKVGGHALTSDHLMKNYNDMYAAGVRRGATLAGHGVDLAKSMQSVVAALASQLAQTTQPASGPADGGAPATDPAPSDDQASAGDGNGTATGTGTEGASQ
jgi:hypothetical protein